MKPHYYNENDPGVAAWLRALIAAGLIPGGDVDERSITDVQVADIAGYTQCHFFAGIGGWPVALRLAGWPDDRPVWTGSCPCQPFSDAGKGKGKEDARHLWPELLRLITECRPSVCIGEQVASKAGRGWFAGVRADLEALAYRVGAADLCAAGAAAPHIRQRLWWVADADGGVASYRHLQRGREHRQQPTNGSTRGLVEPEGGRRVRVAGEVQGTAEGHQGSTPGQGHGDAAGRSGATGRLPDAAGERRERGEGAATGLDADGSDAGRAEGDDGPVGVYQIGDGFWSRFNVIPCSDGKARRVEPGTFPLAHGVPARVGRLRGYGNAIVPQVAAEFVAAYAEAVAALESEVAA